MEFIKDSSTNDTFSTMFEREKEPLSKEDHSAALAVRDPSLPRYDIPTFFEASAQPHMQHKRQLALAGLTWKAMKRTPRGVRSKPSRISESATPSDFPNPPNLFSSAPGGAADVCKAVVWPFLQSYPTSSNEKPQHNPLVPSGNSPNHGAEAEHSEGGGAVTVSGVALTVGIIAILASALSRRKFSKTRKETAMPTMPLLEKENTNLEALKMKLEHLTKHLQEKEAQLEALEDKLIQGQFHEKILVKVLTRERAASVEAQEEFKIIEEAFAVRLERCAGEQKDLHDEIRRLRDQLYSQQAASLAEKEELRLALEVAKTTIKDLEAAKEAFTSHLKESTDEQVGLEKEICRLHDLHGASLMENNQLRRALDEANRTIMDHEALERNLREAAGTRKEAPPVDNAPVVQTHAPALVVPKHLDSDEEIVIAPYGGRKTNITSGEESEDESEATVTDYPDTSVSETETETGDEDDDDGVSDFFNNLSEAEEEAFRTLWSLQEGDRYNVEDLSALPASVFDPSSGQRVNAWKSKRRAAALRALLVANNQQNSGISSSGSSPIPVGYNAVKPRPEETDTEDGLSVFDSDDEESFLYNGMDGLSVR